MRVEYFNGGSEKTLNVGKLGFIFGTHLSKPKRFIESGPWWLAVFVGNLFIEIRLNY